MALSPGKDKAMAMDNLAIYNAVRAVPPEAQKTIKGGRLSGMTDINPMWRIKTLTEQFGPCGIGWYYVIKEKWIDNSMGSDEISANVIIDLFIKMNGEWSMPIEGFGGSMFVAKEKGGLHTNDECYKMALTDAISVACKALGIGADIYWSNDRTKYAERPAARSKPKKEKQEQEEFQPKPLSEPQQQYVRAKAKALQLTKKMMKEICGVMNVEEMDSASLAKFVEYVNAREAAISAAQKEYQQMPADLGL